MGEIIYDLMIRTEGLARNEAYKQRIIDFNSDRHVDGWGDAGDVLLWYRLLAHTAGANRSEKLQLREAVLFDYQQREAEKPSFFLKTWFLYESRGRGILPRCTESEFFPETPQTAKTTKGKKK